MSEESLNSDAADPGDRARADLASFDSSGVEVANEFARVLVRRISTRNGVRLEIESPRSGSTITLDATLLESLTWQTPASLSRFFARPFESVTEHPETDPGT